MELQLPAVRWEDTNTYHQLMFKIQIRKLAKAIKASFTVVLENFKEIRDDIAFKLNTLFKEEIIPSLKEVFGRLLELAEAGYEDEPKLVKCKVPIRPMKQQTNYRTNIDIRQMNMRFTRYRCKH